MHTFVSRLFLSRSLSLGRSSTMKYKVVDVGLPIIGIHTATSKYYKRSQSDVPRINYPKPR